MCERDSDNCLAGVLGVTRATVSKWRGGGAITDEHLARLIEVAQADPALFVRVREEAAATAAEKALWGPLWDRLSPVTTKVAGVLLACGLALPYQQVSARTTQAEPLNPMCIMRSVLAWLRAAWTHRHARWPHGTPAVLA